MKGLRKPKRAPPIEKEPTSVRRMRGAKPDTMCQVEPLQKDVPPDVHMPKYGGA